MPNPLNSPNEFHNALVGEDELGVVLRSHFYIEAELQSLMDSLLPFPKELPRLRFEQKLKLLCALGLDKSLFGPLKTLGDIRNSFGHQIGAHLTDGMTTTLFNAFSLQDQEIVIKGYEQTRRQRSEDLPPYEDLCPKDKFVILSIAIHKMTTEVLLDSQLNRRA